MSAIATEKPGMLYPAMSKLKSHISNRYMLVNVVALRARQIAEDAEETGTRLDEKPVTLALDEVALGKLDASGMDLTIEEPEDMPQE
ncbi:MAG: DNA-directed RNA polymerase subunit omega [Oscillibacter sp.]|nr:DNA-directed RNA polymerase subunit omega [Oscillibacter sp.]